MCWDLKIGRIYMPCDRIILDYTDPVVCQTNVDAASRCF
jgi:hypothetical protein